MGGSEENSLRQREGQGRLCVRYSGALYDVTKFAHRHPGGRDWLVRFSGQDVTEVMHSSTPHRHSEGAFSILAGYRVKGVAEDTPQQETSTDSDYSNAPYYSAQEDSLVDWSRPMLSQIPGLGENYIHWVHQPVDLNLRLFQSDMLEWLSKAPWYLVPLYWIPVALGLLWASWATLSAEGQPVFWNLIVADLRVTAGWLPILVVVGVVLWTFCEYAFHRWLFHMTPPSSSTFFLLLHFLLHGHHHKAPMDSSRLVFPPVPASVLGGVIFCVYSIFVPRAVAEALFAGTVMGYMAYDLTHYYIHHGSPTSPYFARLKRYHVKHHFQHQQLGFGISSKLWDYPFGTLIPDTD
ncbi:fatty acid 2-hydroxylase-like [Babylonia areolata]|uniref:fatty acid 2-hydroxylase-like n=1 Tax=Babylonia areolata TaxID=304850 RepID=UPI003FD67E75